MNARQVMRLSAILAALVLALPGSALATEDEDTAAALAGSAAFTDSAAANAAGYGLPPEGPLSECIMSLDGSAGMGFHWINGDLVGDAELDPGRPEALVYEPTADGGLRLVALEYVVFAEAWDAENDQPPTLFGGQPFHFTDAPNRYEIPAFYALHVWLYKDNPAGMYEGFNPDVSCAGALPDTATAAAMVDGTALPSPVLLIGIAILAAALSLSLLRRRATA
jgi:hypothetical protein